MKLPKALIQNGAFKKIPAVCRPFGKRFVIITDKNLTALGEELRGQMQRAGLKTSIIIIPSGETSKTLSTVEKISGEMCRLGLKRDACVIGLGGGVVGDVAGFVSAIYMRGIAFVSVPTTLLAMGDSCIGGKNGVDLSAGKNLLGTFYQPGKIIVDPLLLRDLPDRAFRGGLAEIIKHSVIADGAFFTFLAKNAAGILAKKPALLQKIISRSIAIKQKIVKADEKESLAKALRGGMSRMLVNYGHTVGHALEKLSNFTLPHGEAVSIGMVAENRVAVGKNVLKQEDAERIAALLKLFHLPTKISAEFSSQEIKKALMMDKKTIDGKLYFALPTKIGAARVISL